MGSLGVMDTKPRAFPPSALNILCNVSWLGQRLSRRAAHGGQNGAAHAGLRIACFEAAAAAQAAFGHSRGSDRV